MNCSFQRQNKENLLGSKTAGLFKKTQVPKLDLQTISSNFAPFSEN